MSKLNIDVIFFHKKEDRFLFDIRVRGDFPSSPKTVENVEGFNLTAFIENEGSKGKQVKVETKSKITREALSQACVI